MQWSGLGQSRAAVVGYNSEGNFFQNHPSSGFSTIANIISCGVNQESRSKRQADPLLLEIIPVELPTDPVLRMRAQTCIDRYLLDIQFLKINPTELADLVSDRPCPPSLDQAINDAARYVMQTESPHCYVSTLSKRSDAVSAAFTIFATQQCCYDDDRYTRH